MKVSRFSNLFLPVGISIVLVTGYFFVGKNSHISGFLLPNQPADANFYAYLIFLGSALIALCKYATCKRTNTTQSGFSFFQLIKIQIVISLLFILERIASYRYWFNLRVDDEQSIWPGTAHYLMTFWKSVPFEIKQLSAWEGLYNKLYIYILVIVNKITPIDYWYKYQIISFCILLSSILILSALVNRIYGKVAAVFLLAVAIFSAYLHFTNYYMKQHIIMIPFFACVMYLVFSIWRKFSFLKVALLSMVCLAAFLGYVACIFYLPVALLALLFSKSSRLEKCFSVFIVSAPCVVYIIYLLTHLQSWPSDYYLGKGIWHDGGGGAPIFFYNIATQLKLLFIPGGIWGWMIQGCFMAGLIYSFKDLKKEVLIWWAALAVAFFAMTSTRDVELGKNFISIVPYLVIASFGADQLWKYHFSNNNFSRILSCFLFLSGLGCELYYSNLSERWQNFQLPGMVTPLDGRIWFFDDAKKLNATLNEEYPIIVDNSLINNGFVWKETDLNTEDKFGNIYGELSVYMKANLMKKADVFPSNCESIFLTDKTNEQMLQYFGNEATVTTLEKYRPSNPRYEYLNYQPDVFHYLYKIRLENNCK